MYRYILLLLFLCIISSNALKFEGIEHKLICAEGIKLFTDTYKPTADWPVVNDNDEFKAFQFNVKNDLHVIIESFTVDSVFQQENGNDNIIIRGYSDQNRDKEIEFNAANGHEQTLNWDITAKQQVKIMIYEETEPPTEDATSATASSKKKFKKKKNGPPLDALLGIVTVGVDTHDKSVTKEIKMGCASYKIKYKAVRNNEHGILIDYDSIYGSSIVTLADMCALAGDFFNGAHSFGTGSDEIGDSIIALNKEESVKQGKVVFNDKATRHRQVSKIFNAVYQPLTEELDNSDKFRRMTSLLMDNFLLEQGALDRVKIPGMESHAFNEAISKDKKSLRDQLEYVSNAHNIQLQLITEGKLPDKPVYGLDIVATADLAKDTFANSPYGRGLFWNFDHFAESGGVLAYQSGHELACAEAAKAKRQPTNGERLVGLKKAILMEGIALHYATDEFAAGHMRTPRGMLYVDMDKKSLGQSCGTRDSNEGLAKMGVLANAVHDEDNYVSLRVKNKLGQEWSAFGDKFGEYAGNRKNKEIGSKFVATSLKEIAQCFSTGQASLTAVRADLDENVPEDYLPTPLPFLPSGGEAAKNHPPLYIKYEDQWYL